MLDAYKIDEDIDNFLKLYLAFITILFPNSIGTINCNPYRLFDDIDKVGDYA